jgi:hypothetical protein
MGRVEDGDVDTDGPSGCNREPDHRLELVPAQATRKPIVHGRHRGVIQRVAVHVDPESVELRSNKALERARRGGGHSLVPHGREVDHEDCGVFDALTPSLGRLGLVSTGELDDILVEDQRPATLEVGEEFRATAGGQGQIHRRDLAVRLRLGLVEVHVPIDEQQPMAAAPPQRENGAEQNRAVPTEHDRDLAGVEHLGSGVRESVRVGLQPVRVADARRRVAPGFVGWGCHLPGEASSDRVGESCVEQRSRKMLDARRGKPQHRRSLNDGERAHDRSSQPDRSASVAS